MLSTSGAKEANKSALKDVADWVKTEHIITAGTRHKDVLDVCRPLADKRFCIAYLEVGRSGQIDPNAQDQAITGD